MLSRELKSIPIVRRDKIKFKNIIPLLEKAKIKLLYMFDKGGKEENIPGIQRFWEEINLSLTKNSISPGLENAAKIFINTLLDSEMNDFYNYFMNRILYPIGGFYHSLVKMPNASFKRSGTVSSYTFELTNEISLTTDMLVENALRTVDTSKTPLTVLDVGGGFGGVVKHLSSEYGKAVRALSYTLAAPDCKSDDQTILGDVSDIAIKCKGLSFHIIFSRFAFNYFTDPLEVLSQIYSLAKPGALIFCDHVTLYGLKDNEGTSLFKYLNQSGYDILTGQKKSAKHLWIAIRKNAKEKLVFPIKRKESISTASVCGDDASHLTYQYYHPSKELINYHRKQTNPTIHTSPEIVAERLAFWIPEIESSYSISTSFILNSIIENLNLLQKSFVADNKNDHFSATAIPLCATSEEKNMTNGLSVPLELREMPKEEDKFIPSLRIHLSP